MNNKIHVIVFFLFAFNCNNSFAQQNRFIGGVLFNINGIELDGESKRFWNTDASTIRIDGTVGFSGGFFVKREFSSNKYLALELRYICKGSIYSYETKYFTRTFETLYLNYIELPILFGYKIKPNEKTYNLECGIAFARLFKGNVKTSPYLFREGTPTTKNIKNTDLSFIGSLKFPIFSKLKKNLLFGLRASTSLISIHKDFKLFNFDYGIEFDYSLN